MNPPVFDTYRLEARRYRLEKTMAMGIRRDYAQEYKASETGRAIIAEEAVELLAGQLKTAEGCRDVYLENWNLQRDRLARARANAKRWESRALFAAWLGAAIAVVLTAMMVARGF